MLDFNVSSLQIDYVPTIADTHPSTDPIENFLAKLAEFNMHPGEIIPDGELHRFDVDKKRDMAGWYVFHAGEICGAGFGNWKADLSEKWCSVDTSTLTYEQRQKYQENQQKIKIVREAQEQKNHLEAKKTAQRIWEAADPVETHPYLKNKGVASHYLRADKTGILFVPMLDENREIWNVERIWPEPGKKKKGLWNGRRDHLFFEIQGWTNEVFVCEGYSTGASIHKATGATVICSFNAGNLPKVAPIVKKIYPSHQIIIAADNDQKTMGNPGITKGSEAAKKIGAPMVFPTFADSDTASDFNDLATIEGLPVVTVQLRDIGKRRKIPPLTAANTSLADWLKKRPSDREYLLTYKGAGFLPKGIVGVLAATGGTGKTYFLLKLAATMADGGKIGPIMAPGAVKTLIVCGEDDQDEVGRRMWDICKGKFPSKLHAASVYGEIGPLMELDGNKPVRADGFYWLESTIKGHPGLELLIIDPKSRFYGLDENNNDHATQWIQCLEYLSKEYCITILFASHTNETNAGRINQTMTRGASAIVDGCRWQAGMCRMDKETADRYHIDDFKSYVVFDIPKSNYSAALQAPMYFKRGISGALEYVSLEDTREANMAEFMVELIANDTVQYSLRDLEKSKAADDLVKDLKANFPSFQRRKDMSNLVRHCLDKNMLKLTDILSGKTQKTILEVV